MKAILIINKPTECVDCPCAIESEGSYWCNAECKDVTTEAYEGIPKWCPLRPIPNKACEMLVKGLDAMEKMKAVEVKVVRRTE